MEQFDVDAALIRRLADLLEETGLSEIEIGDGQRRVRVARGAATDGARAAPPPAPEPAPPGDPGPAAAPLAETSPPGAVTSPMVGTVFVAPEPGAPPFVAVGDAVAAGDTLFVIEAMKVMNPIRAPRAGTVTDILVENGGPVEYGETLLILG